MTEFDTAYDTDQALADVRRIASWLAQDTANDDAQGAASDLNGAADWLGARERTLSISFAGEASEGFADRIDHMKDWYVLITPQEGQPFDAVLVGSGTDVEVDGDTWYDAVTYIPAEPETGLPLSGEGERTVRVQDVFVY